MWPVINLILLCAFLNVTSSMMTQRKTDNSVKQSEDDFKFVDFQYNKDYEDYDANYNEPDVLSKSNPVLPYKARSSNLPNLPATEEQVDIDNDDSDDEDIELEYPTDLADDVTRYVNFDYPTDDDDEEIPEKEMPCYYGTKVNPYPEKIINRTGRTVSDIKCEEYMWDHKYKIIDAQDNAIKCKLAKDISDVVGGTVTGTGEFPHMGAVAWIVNGKSVFGCGCSLISPRFAITAAHCSSMPTNTDIVGDSIYPKFVRFGSASIIGGNNTEGRTDVNITEFIRHHHHINHKKYDDIALIKLSEELIISANLRLACLWSKGAEKLTTAIITGWGSHDRENHQSVMSPRLLQAEVSVINSASCDQLLINRRNRNFCHGIVASQICALTPPSKNVTLDACQGDSGGPLQVRKTLPMATNAFIHHLVGIVSFGIQCAEAGLPGVYTNIEYYRCWIEKTVWPEERNSCKEPARLAKCENKKKHSK